MHTDILILGWKHNKP